MAEFFMDEQGPYQNGYREGYEDGRKASKETIRTLAERNAYLEEEVKRLQGDIYQKLGSAGG